MKHLVAAAFVFLMLALVPNVAAAHVKWFCAYDVSEAPKNLDWMLDLNFVYLVGVAAAVFLAASLIDFSVLGRGIVWVIDRATAPIRQQTEILMRATYGAFFISLWGHGGIILTPELTTQATAISWLQLAIAGCFMWQRTLVLAAAGMVFLYGFALQQYGLFHLMDYPVFLGAAGYFAMTGMGKTPWDIRPVDVVRIAASLTLMWASVEKWGYPQWTYPLFVSHPEMSLGFGVDFYMKAAGVVEFSLAFALLGTPLMRRVAALILANIFVAAIPEFGKIDAIGHAPIVVVMLAIIADNQPGRRRALVFAPAGYLVALGVFVAIYYGGHASLFPGAPLQANHADHLIRTAVLEPHADH